MVALKSTGEKGVAGEAGSLPKSFVPFVNRHLDKPDRIHRYLANQAMEGSIRGKQWGEVTSALMGQGAAGLAMKALEGGSRKEAKALAALIAEDGQRAIAELSPEISDRVFGARPAKDTTDKREAPTHAPKTQSDEATEASQGAEPRALQGAPLTSLSKSTESSSRVEPPETRAAMSQELKVAHTAMEVARRLSLVRLTELGGRIEARLMSLAESRDTDIWRFLRSGIVLDLIKCRDQVADSKGTVRALEVERTVFDLDLNRVYFEDLPTERTKHAERLFGQVPGAKTQARHAMLTARGLKLRSCLLKMRNRLDSNKQIKRSKTSGFAGAINGLANDDKGLVLFVKASQNRAWIDAMLNKIDRFRSVPKNQTNQVEEALDFVEAELNKKGPTVRRDLQEAENNIQELSRSLDGIIGGLEAGAEITGIVAGGLAVALLSTASGGAFLAAGWCVMEEGTKQVRETGRISNPGILFLQGLSGFAGVRLAGSAKVAGEILAKPLTRAAFFRSWRQTAVQDLTTIFSSAVINAVKDGAIIAPLVALENHKEAALILNDPNRLADFLLEHAAKSFSHKELLRTISQSARVGGQ